ncbi:MAG: hypothetical protein ACK5DD_05620 [Cyclobacteriaceae bacterium]
MPELIAGQKMRLKGMYLIGNQSISWILPHQQKIASGLLPVKFSCAGLWPRPLRVYRRLKLGIHITTHTARHS